MSIVLATSLQSRSYIDWKMGSNPEESCSIYQERYPFSHHLPYPVVSHPSPYLVIKYSLFSRPNSVTHLPTSPPISLYLVKSHPFPTYSIISILLHLQPPISLHSRPSRYTKPAASPHKKPSHATVPLNNRRKKINSRSKPSKGFTKQACWRRYCSWGADPIAEICAWK